MDPSIFQTLWSSSPIIAVFAVAIIVLWKKCENTSKVSRDDSERTLDITKDLMEKIQGQQEKRINGLQKEVGELLQRMDEKDRVFEKVVDSYRDTINEFKECNTRIAKMEADVAEIKNIVKNGEEELIKK